MNPGRAIALCCTAKIPKSRLFTARATHSGACGTESMDLGTQRLPTNPMAYRKAAKKMA